MQNEKETLYEGNTLQIFFPIPLYPAMQTKKKRDEAIIGFYRERRGNKAVVLDPGHFHASLAAKISAKTNKHFCTLLYSSPLPKGRNLEPIPFKHKRL